MIWHGSFIDAKRRWTGRGKGKESWAITFLKLPEGVHSPPLPPGQMATRSSPKRWAITSAAIDWARSSGQRFFLIFMTSMSEEEMAPWDRTMSMYSADAYYSLPRHPPSLFRAAVADKIETVGGCFTNDGQWKMKLSGGGSPSSDKRGQGRALVPVAFEGGGQVGEIDGNRRNVSMGGAAMEKTCEMKSACIGIAVCDAILGMTLSAKTKPHRRRIQKNSLPLHYEAGSRSGSVGDMYATDHSPFRRDEEIFILLDKPFTKQPRRRNFTAHEAHEVAGALLYATAGSMRRSAAKSRGSRMPNSNGRQSLNIVTMLREMGAYPRVAFGSIQ